MQINFSSFLETLPIMAKGMAGIFLVTLVIILVMILLNAISGSIERKNEQNHS